MNGLVNMLKGIGDEFELGLVDVLPCCAAPYGLDRLTAQPKLGGENINHPAISNSRSDLSDILSRYLRATMIFSAPRVLHTAPTRKLFQHIPALRAPVEVSRIAARWVIARVQREEPGGAAFACCEQRELGRLDARALEPKRPIAFPCTSAGIRPALIGIALLDIRPETVLVRLCNFINAIVSHGAVLSRFGQGRALLTQRFRPVRLSRYTLRFEGESA